MNKRPNLAKDVIAHKWSRSLVVKEVDYRSEGKGLESRHEQKESLGKKGSGHYSSLCSALSMGLKVLSLTCGPHLNVSCVDSFA